MIKLLQWPIQYSTVLTSGTCTNLFYDVQKHRFFKQQLKRHGKISFVFVQFHWQNGMQLFQKASFVFLVSIQVVVRHMWNYCAFIRLFCIGYRDCKSRSDGVPWLLTLGLAVPVPALPCLWKPLPFKEKVSISCIQFQCERMFGAPFWAESCYVEN